MKKSVHALLTAAMFATALGLPGTVTATDGNAPTASAPDAVYDPAEDIPQPVYGPPETFTTTTPTETTTTTTTIPQGVYGPPWVFYPAGDVTMDNVLDARDFSGLLSAFQTNDEWALQFADLNQDGEANATDLALLEDFLAGKITHFNYRQYPVQPEVTTTTETTTTETTTTTSETTTLDVLLTTTSTTTATVYGPPIVQ